MRDVKSLVASAKKETEYGIEQWRAVIVHEEEAYCYDNGPRDWENIGKMYCINTWHCLGDIQFTSSEAIHETVIEEVLAEVAPRNKGIREWEYDRCLTWEYIVRPLGDDEEEETPFEEETGYRQVMRVDDFLDLHTVMLTLHVYDHSGLTMNTCGFSCPWDSGAVGVIWSTKDGLRDSTGYTEEELFGKERKAEQVLDNEVKDYDCWLRGEVFGVLIEVALPGEECYETVDSCWGYVGLDDACEQAAAQLNHYIDEPVKSPACRYGLDEITDEVDVVEPYVEPERLFGIQGNLTDCISWV